MAANNAAVSNVSDRDKQVLQAVSEALRFLARFADRELDKSFLGQLRRHTTTDWLAIEFETDKSKIATADLDQAISQLPTSISHTLLDTLAAEYADLFLNHNYRISPTASFWLTEENLERQEPMFAVRKFYKKYDIKVENWRVRADDHIVHELQFIAHLIETATPVALTDGVHFLDQYVLTWLPDFCAAAAERVKQPIYVAALGFVDGIIEELRDYLETLTGIARPEPEPEQTPQDRIRLYDADLERPYMPGTSESW